MDPVLDAHPAEDSQPSPPSPRTPRLAERVLALIEVLLCSDILTQLALGGTLGAFGYQPFVQGRLNVTYVVALSLGDTLFLIGLILLMLYAHGERPRDVLFGRRAILAEAALGLPLILAALALAVTVLLTIQRLAPSLHTVQDNPLQELLRSPRDAWLFAFVVVAAGGVREEIQRAFLLHRFEVWLGGRTFGVIATSAAFGAGHVMQGLDAAVTTGLLGAFWGIIYLRRRSAAAPIVSHAGFDLVQILQFVAVGK